MEGPKASPQSFAELWEKLGMAHAHELQELREENFRMRCRLAYTMHEFPCCGTFEDSDGAAITVGAVGDSIVVAFPAKQTELKEGDVNVLGISGKYNNGFIKWDNGSSWRKTHDATSNPFTAEDAESGSGRTEDENSKRESSRTPPNGPGPEDEEVAARQETNGGPMVEEVTTDPSGISRGKPKKKMNPFGRLRSDGNLADTAGKVLQNFATPKEKETLPFSKGKTQIKRGETIKCGAYIVLESIVRSIWFEVSVWLLVVFSAVVLAAELQYVGDELGFEMGYAGYNTNPAEEYPGAVTVFDVLEWIFGISFTVYLILKVTVHRGDFCRGKESLWNITDLLIVVLWWIWQIDQRGGHGDPHFKVKINPQILRVFRLSRLIRHLKLVRRFMTFDSLHVMTTALKGSFHVFIWAMLLLCLFQTIMALLITSTIQEVYLEVDTNDPEKRKEVYKYFGTFTRTFLTMFELSLANWPTASRVLTENISEWWTVFAILHKLTIGFALVGIINGVFMQETFKVAASDDRIMLRQKQAAGQVHEIKMRALFKHLDTSHDGKVDMKEFQQIVSDKEVKDWLAAQDITVTDADSLFKLIAPQGKYEITSDELIAGLGRLKGNVRTLDFMLLRQQLLENRDIFRKVAGLDRS